VQKTRSLDLRRKVSELQLRSLGWFLPSDKYRAPWKRLVWDSIGAAQVLRDYCRDGSWLTPMSSQRAMLSHRLRSPVASVGFGEIRESTATVRFRPDSGQMELFASRLPARLGRLPAPYGVTTEFRGIVHKAP